MYVAILTKLVGETHKYEVRIFKLDGDKLIPLDKVKFGAAEYGDYTLGTSDMQKRSYIARHKNNEDWTKTGYFKAGFWSRWILWNKRTVQESIEDIEKRFSNIKVFLM
jgi:hypothetical protein